MLFYYWRTSFRLDSLEKLTLQKNRVSSLYTRYFDVDMLPGDTVPKPIAPISFDDSVINLSIIPVVFIKNRVMLQLDSTRILQLAQNIYSLVNSMNRLIKNNNQSIQFDCDWTEGSKKNYFLFLTHYKKMSSAIISATIRLHQVKYRLRTGVPPVDYGALMFYNMGDINAGTTNSIYEKSIAEKYIPSLPSYPLALDVALPIFAWSQQISGGRVVKLLNKMNFTHFENDSNFTRTAKNHYSVKHACFLGGYYFKEHDVVKTEGITKDDLNSIISSINLHSNKHIRNIIFYDLDSENLALFEKDVYTKILDRLN